MTMRAEIHRLSRFLSWRKEDYFILQTGLFKGLSRDPGVSVIPEVLRT